MNSIRAAIDLEAPAFPHNVVGAARPLVCRNYRAGDAVGFGLRVGGVPAPARARTQRLSVLKFGAYC
jgi:hypothetical protein